jgi:hypothetical protein
MRFTISFTIKSVLGFGVALGMASMLSAQEGHPVKGSWIGEWEGNSTHGENVLMVMDWDGEKISGIINPGTDNIAIDNAMLNPDDWSIRIEAGPYVIQGTFVRLELPNRSIEGTWQNGGNRGDFEIVRQ